MRIFLMATKIRFNLQKKKSWSIKDSIFSFVFNKVQFYLDMANKVFALSGNEYHSARWVFGLKAPVSYCFLWYSGLFDHECLVHLFRLIYLGLWQSFRQVAQPSFAIFLLSLR
ncbi:hypothetical protein C7120_04060 [Prevotella sp. oral taxon 376]|nr:hypothetical protein C7120_04060 [Prevotella sp. oral taxon 376]